MFGYLAKGVSETGQESPGATMPYLLLDGLAVWAMFLVSAGGDFKSQQTEMEEEERVDSPVSTAAPASFSLLSSHCHRIKMQGVCLLRVRCHWPESYLFVPYPSA